MRYIKVPDPVTLVHPVTGASGQVLSFLELCVTVPLANRAVWGASMESLFKHRRVREKLDRACNLHEHHGGTPVHVALEDDEHKLLKTGLEDREGLTKSGVVLDMNSESQALDHYEAILEAATAKPTEGLLVSAPDDVVDLSVAKARD